MNIMIEKRIQKISSPENVFLQKGHKPKKLGNQYSGP